MKTTDDIRMIFFFIMHAIGGVNIDKCTLAFISLNVHIEFMMP